MKKDFMRNYSRTESLVNSVSCCCFRKELSIHIWKLYTLDKNWKIWIPWNSISTTLYHTVRGIHYLMFHIFKTKKREQTENARSIKNAQLDFEQRSNRQRNWRTGKDTMDFQGNSPCESRACTFTKIRSYRIMHSVDVSSGKRQKKIFRSGFIRGWPVLVARFTSL